MQQIAADRVLRNRRVLRDLPRAPRSISERREPFQRLLAIVRPHREPFLGAPHELLLVIGALQIFRNRRFPFRRADGGEVLHHIQNLHFRHERPPALLPADTRKPPLPWSSGARRTPSSRATLCAAPYR